MTNQEKFIEVFGHDLHREFATKTWWEQEFKPLPPIMPEPCDDEISRQAAIDVIER